MNEIRSWLTVRQAAFVVGRSTTALYSWIAAEKLVTRIDEKGVTLVQHVSLMRVEGGMRRGRPRHAQQTK